MRPHLVDPARAHCQGLEEFPPLRLEDQVSGASAGLRGKHDRRHTIRYTPLLRLLLVVLCLLLLMRLLLLLLRLLLCLRLLLLLLTRGGRRDVELGTVRVSCLVRVRVRVER